MYNRGLTGATENWLYTRLIREKLDNTVGYFLLLAVSILVAILLPRFEFKFAILAAGVVIVFPLLFNCIINYRFGFLFTMVYAYGMHTLGRLAPVDLPIGTVPDIILLFTLIGVVKERGTDGLGGKDLNHPIKYIFFVWIFYLFIQIANPSLGSMMAWALYFKGTITLLIFYISASYILDSLDFIKTFTKLWVFLSFLAALYCLHQEYVGFLDFEYNWIFQSEERYSLIHIWGRFRKWSFLADVASFGMTMSFSAVFCLILALGPFKPWKRLALFGGGLIMLLAMNYSGTRTATAMIPAGVIIFALMTIRSKKTLAFLILTIVVFVGLYFGPFYGSNMRRIRSTFQATEDASMDVRNYNRSQIQPYIHSHPIGGGLGMSGNGGYKLAPGHPLAGFPPDSGYLQTAVEAGWIGLIIEMILYATVMIVGIKNYFRVRNQTIKYMYAAYVAAFFSLTIANYPQIAMVQKPMGFIAIAIFVLVFRLKDFDD